MGKTEQYVSKLDGKSVSNWTLADSFEVGRWLAKIFVGILMKEATVSLDRRKPEFGSIFPVEATGELYLLHLLIQSWRKVILFRAVHTEHPFTLYVYEIEEDTDFGSFNFSTNIPGKSVCIRFGTLGFAFVGDGGLQHEAGNGGPFRLAFQKIHPVQFDEIAARVHYKASLRSATHSYFHEEDATSLRFQQMEVIPYSKNNLADGSDRIFRDWSDKDLAHFFKLYNVPRWDVLVDPSGSASFTRLVDSTGRKIDFF
ncbi:hypothetical protein [Ruegeria arenilitoris]|uniref:hypothetical protein n=1 Tax=Ruegeria arenilitoris TaxID=1173585 RepID=UPI001C2BBF59|nr:hypothetical protein [Ruegeria arenilitoris]